MTSLLYSKQSGCKVLKKVVNENVKFEIYRCYQNLVYTALIHPLYYCKSEE